MKTWVYDWRIDDSYAWMRSSETYDTAKDACYAMADYALDCARNYGENPQFRINIIGEQT